MNSENNTDPEKLPWLGRKLLWVDNPANVKRIFFALIFICIALFAVDFIYHRHVLFSFENFPGFYAIFGFAAFCIVIFGAKALRVLIKRNENYYSPYSVDSEKYPERGLDKASYLDD